MQPASWKCQSISSKVTFSGSKGVEVDAMVGALVRELRGYNSKISPGLVNRDGTFRQNGARSPGWRREPERGRSRSSKDAVSRHLKGAFVVAAWFRYVRFPSRWSDLEPVPDPSVVEDQPSIRFSAEAPL